MNIRLWIFNGVICLLLLQIRNVKSFMNNCVNAKQMCSEFQAKKNPRMFKQLGLYKVVILKHIKNSYVACFE